jgi:hypothetical protein
LAFGARFDETRNFRTQFAGGEPPAAILKHEEPPVRSERAEMTGVRIVYALELLANSETRGLRSYKSWVCWWREVLTFVCLAVDRQHGCLLQFSEFNS